MLRLFCEDEVSYDSNSPQKQSFGVKGNILSRASLGVAKSITGAFFRHSLDSLPLIFFCPIFLHHLQLSQARFILYAPNFFRMLTGSISLSSIWADLLTFNLPGIGGWADFVFG